MTNEEVMKTMTDMGLHEGGMDNWVADNAWVKFANTTRNATLDEIADKIDKMPFGDTAASFAVWIREQKT
jgi:hypothetical protein